MDTSNPSRSHSGFRRALTLAFAIWFACVNSMSSIAMAQSTGADFEAPIIEHEETSTGSINDVETFVATVVDNEELESVSLFYRLAGETAFTELPMESLSAAPYYFSANINVGELDSEASAIEYYIRAEDTSGNLVLKGFAFEPLVRSLLPAEGPVDSTGSQGSVAVSEPASVPAQTAPKSKINWLYVALGALLIGGIAAGASGGGSDDGPVSNCAPDCQVTLTISPP